MPAVSGTPLPWREYAGERACLGQTVSGSPCERSPARRPARRRVVLHHGLASSQHIWDLMLPALSRTLPGRDVRCARPRPQREAVGRLRVRSHGRRRDGRASRDPRAAADAGRSLVGSDGGARACRPASASAAAASCSSTAGSPRCGEGFATWAEARTALSPPHLAGTPVEEFRAMIPMFFGDAVEVTPEVEDIVLAVMRVRRRRHDPSAPDPREPPPDPARDLGAGPARAARASAHAGARDPRAGRRRRLGRATPGGRRRAAGVRLADAHRAWMDGIHDLPLQHPLELARRIRAFARTAVR